jgi:hypothetical protein
METNTQVSQTVESTDPAPVPITPEDLVTQLRAYRERIPNYGQLTILQAQQRRKAASLKPGFVVASINAAGASETVQSALGQSPAAMQDQQSEIVRWTAVEDELRAMLKGVVSANLVRRHRLGTAALQTYAISRNLVRQPEHADLLPHVQEMTRLSKRTKKADKKTEQKPADPASQQTTPSPAEPHPAPSHS